MQIHEMDHPYLLSPPDPPVTGATSTTADSEGDGVPWDHILTSRVDRPGDHARVCASGS